jgi:nucleolar protein 56
MSEFQELKKELMDETKERLKDSVYEEIILFQEYYTLNELNRSINKLTVKLTEWFSMYVPEITKLESQEEIIKLISLKDKKSIIQELTDEGTIGSKSSEGFDEALALTDTIKGLLDYKEKLEEKISSLTKSLAPNMCEVIEPLTAANLLSKVGGLAKLARMPSTAVQLVGAEKALFRHLRNKKHNPPKYGLLSGSVESEDNRDKAKKTKKLAAQVSIASRRDHFGNN